MFGLGVPELIIIGIIILLIFGAKRIPEIGKGIGGAIREIKNIKKEIKGAEPKKENSKQLQEGNKDKDKGASSSLEVKVTKKVLEHVPGVKKVMDINDKVNKVKEIIK